MAKRTTTRGVRCIPGVMGGVACVKGTRIPVWMIVERVQHDGLASVMEDYPFLHPDQLGEALLYYAANRILVWKDKLQNQG